MTIDKTAVLARLNYRAFYESCGVRFADARVDANSNAQAFCPFHDDRRPSFSIQLTAPGKYHCFGCAHEGDVFRFCEVLYNDTFVSAVERLATFAGFHSNGAVAHPNEPATTGTRPTSAKVAELEADEIITSWTHALLQGAERLREVQEMYGLNAQTVTAYRLGWDGMRFTIPLPTTKQGARMAVKRHYRRAVPKSKNPANIPVQLYGVERLAATPTDTPVLVVEGEFKALLAWQLGFAAVSSTGGAGTFLAEWSTHFQDRDVVVLYDADEAGQSGARKVAMALQPTARSVRVIQLPLPGTANAKDLTDWVREGHTAADLRRLIEASESLRGPHGEESSLSRTAAQLIEFPPLTPEALSHILGRTIKKDDANKQITFLCELSAYTEDAQFNIINNAPSSSGKSYIPTEIASLFPEEDVVAIGYCSPTAFFHDIGQYDKALQGYVIDLSRKVLIFLDQPHTLLLQHLRPLLSHDKKELHLKITDKSQKAGLRTKNIFLRGFPAVIFCTSNLKIDEQEATRSLLLSPETHQEKLREAIHQRADKEADAEAYRAELEQDSHRQALKARVAAIRAMCVTYIKVPAVDVVKERFFRDRATLKPRHMRDIGRLMSLVKAWALFNAWHRRRTGSVLEANDADIEAAFRLWEQVARSQELNLPPYIYDLFQEIVLPAYQRKGSGLSRQELLQEHHRVYGRFLPDWQLRQQVIPMLEIAGLIVQEPDPNDRRRMLIVPVSGNSE